MGAPFFAFFAKGGHDADGIKRFFFVESKKRERNNWSGREDLNLRPPGPEAVMIKNLSASFGVA
jgi:hypothetical protein